MLAPCCHPQIELSKYSNSEWIQKNFHTFDFEWMKHLIFHSKHRLRTCQDQRIREKLPAGAWEYGRYARRLMEEGRIQRLKAEGLDCEVVEYVPTSVTPDNLLLIFRPPGRPKPDPPTGLSEGVHLSLPVHIAQTRRDTIPFRVAQYVLELRKDHPCIGTVTVTWVEETSRPTILITTDNLKRLIKVLDENIILLHLQVLIFPFTHVVKSLKQVGPWLQKQHAIRGNVYPVRIQAFPRPDEKDLFPAICDGKCAGGICDMLSPTEYKSCVTSVRSKDSAGNTIFDVSVTSNADGMHPRERALRGRELHAQPRMQTWLNEAQRFTSVRGNVLLVCEDPGREEMAAQLNAVRARPLWDQGWSLDVMDTDLQTYDTIVVDVYCWLDEMPEVLSAIKSKLKEDGQVLLHIRLTDLKTNSERRLHKRQATAARILLKYFEHVQIEHLVTDKETDRLVICNPKKPFDS